MKKLLCLFITLCTAFSVPAQNFQPSDVWYGTAFWTPDTLGNHRAVVKVTENTEAVRASIPWRRKDHDAAQKGIIIVDATTGLQITNFLRETITREEGVLIFEPKTVPGNYYIYYLPYHTSGGPYPKVEYRKETTQPAPAWLAKIEKAIASFSIPNARFVQFQSRGDFNSFYPMEIVATSAEKEKLEKDNPGKAFLLFPENREHPVKMFKDIPYRWTVSGAFCPFAAKADQNEYFVFQIALWAKDREINEIKVEFSDLQGNKNTIPASAFTCFNLTGTDWLQRPMNIPFSVPKDEIRPLWIGVQMPTGIAQGIYKGKITVSGNRCPPETIDLTINLSDRVLEDKGDSDIHRLSRLRWLNSELACDNSVVRPFTPLKVNGKEIQCLGRSVLLGESGLPEKISSFFTEEVTTIGKKATPVLHAPIRFVIEQNKKALSWQNESFRFITQGDGQTDWETQNRAGNFTLTCIGKMEFDGFMEYKMIVKANETTKVEDIRLEIPLNGEIAKYWLGMGHTGSFIPDKNFWKWDVKNNQEGFWIGKENAGIHCVFRDEHYVRPLNTNFYHSKPLIIPECWNNNGKGGIDFARKGKTMLIKTYSGSRTLKKGEEMTFIFLLSTTPFKPLDTEKQWADRYYHSYKPVDQIVANGANTINIHHGNAINPHINYPFFRPDYMKAYIDEAHTKGCKVKIYYTVRELANRAPELWALRSLGNEIFSEGKGNGYSWLQEHLDQDYIAAWFVEKYTDAAIVNSGVSRWHNFYVEGLNWLVENVGIDGLYIDDLAFDRTTMKRIRKVLDKGCPAPRIDLHSANQFNKNDGFINSACLYMEHMPYLDRLWLGEYFDYDASPDYWMTEVAGIPFGMMGEMLQDCGNPWRGMVYGMTSRLHYGGCETAQYLWKTWDEFGIQGSRMIGYWVSYNPIKTGNDKILATCYIKGKKVMIAIGSWAEQDEEIKLKIDWKALGIDSKTAKLYAPSIETFQPEKTFSPTDKIMIEKGKGFLLILE